MNIDGWAKGVFRRKTVQKPITIFKKNYGSNSSLTQGAMTLKSSEEITDFGENEGTAWNELKIFFFLLIEENRTKQNWLWFCHSHDRIREKSLWPSGIHKRVPFLVLIILENKLSKWLKHRYPHKRADWKGEAGSVTSFQLLFNSWPPSDWVCFNSWILNLMMWHQWSYICLEKSCHLCASPSKQVLLYGLL